MEITRTSPEQFLIRFESNPSAATAQLWAQQAKEELIGGAKHAIVDLKGFPVVSSLLMGVVVKIFKAMEQQNGTLSVEISSKDVLKVFEVFQLTTLFEVKLVSA